jgi:hypothetical protein
MLDDGVVFPVETGLLQHTSIYFSGLFRYDRTWLESRSRVVRLEDVEGDAFAVYKLWLDTGSTDSPSAIFQQTQPQLEQEETAEEELNNCNPDGDIVFGNKNNIFESTLDGRLDLLTHCYFLGDYIGTPAFQNDVMDEISHLYHDLHNTDSKIPLHNIGYICQRTTATSPLRRFVVNAIRCGLSKKTLTQAAELDLIPLDVVVAIAADAIGDVDEPWKAPNHCLPWLANPCTFHAHPKGAFNAPCLDPFSINGREDELWDIKPWQQDFSGNQDW